MWKEVRFRGLPKTQAEQIVGELLALSFRIMPIVHLLPSALQIGLSYQLALYDSLYIALAVDLNCPLVTVDDRQRNGAIATCDRVDVMARVLIGFGLRFVYLV